jgi:hypothetical protein
MRERTRIRRRAAAAAVTAATLAFAARPAMAATEGDTSTFATVQGGASALSCSLGGYPATGGWSCDTPAPLVASGSDCIQSTHVDVNARSVTVPLTGCSASLLIPSSGWQGTDDCVYSSTVGHQCEGVLAAGYAYFSFQPVLGETFVDELATITDGECTGSGGRATVESTGFTADGNVFSMAGTITWVGDCSSVSTLTWAGTVTVG